MSSMKSVIITLPKELSKTIPNELSYNAWAPKLNFTTSILSDKTTRMDSAIRKVTAKEEAHDIKPAETSVRGKKRRLDHLTWEEKLQRKKLKNRVAAQTSRDRKKAKLDELEETVRTLRERTEQLTQQCTMLSSQNEKLLAENKRLRSEIDVVRDQQQQYCSLCQSRVGCAVPSTGSAAGWNSTAGIVSDTDARSSRPVEDYDFLSTLEELFKDLPGDDCEKLQELAESLMQEVPAEVEANTQKSNEQASLEDDSVKQSEYSNAMVGQASENVEAGRTGGGVNDISYLDDISDPHSVVCNTASTASLKSIKAEIKQESEIVPETVYGTYDEATNSITIFYGEENGDCVNIQECVQEVVSTGEQQLESVCPVVEDTGVATHLIVPSANHTSYPTQFSPTYKDAMSPATSDVYSDADSAGVFTAAFHATKLDCASPDGGYESHDSPDSRQSNLLTDLGMESFTELFPELLT